MKLNNKFIAVGLGLGLFFTGTYMSYSWFTDSSTTTNTITINKLINEIVYKYNTEANIEENEDIKGPNHDKEKREIEIKLPKELEEKVSSATIISTGGEVVRENIKAVAEDDEIDIRIGLYMKPFDIKNFNGTKESQKDFIELKLQLKDNRWIQYKIVLIRDGKSKSKLIAYWQFIDDGSSLILDEEELPNVDEENPPVTDEPTEDESDKPVTLPELEEDQNNGAVTLPEIEESENSGEVIVPEIDESKAPEEIIEQEQL